jgi:hypothetical protein
VAVLAGTAVRMVLDAVRTPTDLARARVTEYERGEWRRSRRGDRPSGFMSEELQAKCTESIDHDVNRARERRDAVVITLTLHSHHDSNLFKVKPRYLRLRGCRIGCA